MDEKKKIRTSGFVRVGEIIPGVLRDIERKRRLAMRKPSKKETEMNEEFERKNKEIREKLDILSQEILSLVEEVRKNPMLDIQPVIREIRAASEFLEKKVKETNSNALKEVS